MKKASLLSGAAFAVPPQAQPGGNGKGAKPIPTIPTIGTMRKDATPEQRKAFAKMKHQMKTAARNIRHDQHLREQEARDKP